MTIDRRKMRQITDTFLKVAIELQFDLKEMRFSN
jgi:hypothetical protein